MITTVLEKIVTVFTGDASAYNRVLNNVKTSTQNTVNSIERSLNRLSGKITTFHSPIGLGAFQNFQPGTLGTSLVGGVGRMGRMVGAGAAGVAGVGSHWLGILNAIGNTQTAAGKFFSHFRTGVHRLGYDLRTLGIYFNRYVTIPIIGLATASVYGFSKFEDELRTTTALFGGLSDASSRALQGTIFGISRSSRTGPLALVKATQQMASANYSAEESMKVLGVAERFSVAGIMDMADATKYLLGVQGALNLRTEDLNTNLENMTRIADVLVKANQLAQGSVEDFAQALTNKGAAAIRVLGKDMTEGVAILAAYASQNVKGAEAGEKLYMVLRDIPRAALENQRQWEALLGRNMVFTKSGELKNIGDIVTSLQKKFALMTDEQQTAAFKLLGLTDRSSIATRQLLGMGEAIAYFNRELEDASGSMDKVYNERLKSFTSSMLKLWNKIQIVGIGIGELLVPMMNYLSDALGKVIDWWEGLDNSTQKFIVYSVLAVASIGVIITTLSALALTVSTVVSGLMLLGPIITAVAGFLATWGDVILVVGAALGGVFYLMKDYVVDFVRKSLGFMAHFSENMRIIAEYIQKNWTVMFLKMAENNVHNFGVMLGGMVRLSATFLGWLGRKFVTAFEEIFLNQLPLRVAAGLIKAAIQAQNYAGRIAIAIASGGIGALADMAREIDKALFKSSGDFTKALLEDDLAASIKRVVGDISKDFKSLADGMTPLELVLTDPVTNKEEPVVSGVKKITKLVDDLHDSVSEPFRMVFESKGVEGILADSAEAFDAVRMHFEEMGMQAEAHLNRLLGSPAVTDMLTPEGIPVQMHPGPPPMHGTETVEILRGILEELKISNKPKMPGIDFPTVKLAPLNLR